jgi:hypothetical protein
MQQATTTSMLTLELDRHTAVNFTALQQRLLSRQFALMLPGYVPWRTYLNESVVVDY